MRIQPNYVCPALLLGLVGCSGAPFWPSLTLGYDERGYIGGVDPRTATTDEALGPVYQLQKSLVAAYEDSAAFERGAAYGAFAINTLTGAFLVTDIGKGPLRQVAFTTLSALGANAVIGAEPQREIYRAGILATACIISEAMVLRSDPPIVDKPPRPEPGMLASPHIPTAMEAAPRATVSPSGVDRAIRIYRAKTAEQVGRMDAAIASAIIAGDAVQGAQVRRLSAARVDVERAYAALLTSVQSADRQLAASILDALLELYVEVSDRLADSVPDPSAIINGSMERSTRSLAPIVQDIEELRDRTEILTLVRTETSFDGGGTLAALQPGTASASGELYEVFGRAVFEAEATAVFAQRTLDDLARPVEAVFDKCALQ